MQKNHLRSFLVYALIVPLLCTKTLFAIAKNSYLTQAERSFRSGQYEDALSYFLKSDGDEQVAGIAGASRIYVITGQYTAAEKICRESLKEFPDAVEIICLLAKILTLTGRSDEALSLLSGIVEGPDATHRSLVQYGKLLELRGRRAEAVPYFERAVARYNEGMITNAEDIAMTAVAAWALESYHDANDLFREALQVDPNNLEAQVLWGDLFLEKYNPSEARVSYDKALNQNPRYVPALTGMAKTSKGRLFMMEYNSVSEL